MNFAALLAAGALALLPAAPALAAPGAHGPDGEHLDAPAQAGEAASAPRLEASSETFELVATLAGGELSILVDRFATNEPVLNAKVEVDAGGRKALARFHADHGDYSVADAAVVRALQQPGEHALVFTIASGAETDLLDGTLRVGAAAESHGHGGLPDRRYAIAGAAGLLLAVAGTLFVVRRRRAAAGALR